MKLMTGNNWIPAVPVLLQEQGRRRTALEHLRKPHETAGAEGSMTIRVAGAQIPVTRDISENRRAILRAIEAASRERADILLTPEGSLSGYTHEFDQGEVEKAPSGRLPLSPRARPRPGAGHVLHRGRRAVLRPAAPVRCQGSFLGFHGKTLTCGTLSTPSRGEIEHFSIAPLRTFVIKGIPCGALICNDLWANPGYTPTPDTHLIPAARCFRGPDNLSLRERRSGRVTLVHCQPLELPRVQSRAPGAGGTAVHRHGGQLRAPGRAVLVTRRRCRAGGDLAGPHAAPGRARFRGRAGPGEGAGGCGNTCQKQVIRVSFPAMDTSSAVARFRGFNRFYTNLIGVLDRHILRSPGNSAPPPAPAGCC